MFNAGLGGYTQMGCREDRQQRRIFISIFLLDRLFVVVSFFLLLIVFVLGVLILAIILGEVCGGMSALGVWGGEGRMFLDASARLLRAKQGGQHFCREGAVPSKRCRNQ
jgi:hypothetical protein